MYTCTLRRLAALLLTAVPVASACASSGASSGTSSSSLPEWAAYTGTYQFDSRLRGGDFLGGYVVLHSPEEYSVRFTTSHGRGRSCANLRNRERSSFQRADLNGNRLSITCGDLSLQLRRDLDGLEGSAAWTSLVDRTRRVCERYETDSRGVQYCASFREESYQVRERQRGNLKLLKTIEGP